VVPCTSIAAYLSEKRFQEFLGVVSFFFFDHIGAMKVRKPSVVALFGIALIAAIAACSGATTQTVDATVCSSKTQWIGGDDGNEEMHPGRDCIECHSREDGPSFQFAGTVFPKDSENDDCFGTANAVVEITGADGKTISLTTNAAGNFHTNSAVAKPYTAKVLVGGKVVAEMGTPQTSGSCNSCHAQTPTGGAPGRIPSN